MKKFLVIILLLFIVISQNCVLASNISELENLSSDLGFAIIYRNKTSEIIKQMKSLGAKNVRSVMKTKVDKFVTYDLSKMYSKSNSYRNPYSFCVDVKFIYNTDKYKGTACDYYRYHSVNSKPTFVFYKL